MATEMEIERGIGADFGERDLTQMELRDDETEMTEERAEAETAQESDFTLSSVQQYLRDIGSISLLSREREVELAKAIEEGQGQIQRALASTPMAVGYVVRLGWSVRAGEIDLTIFWREATARKNPAMSSMPVLSCSESPNSADSVKSRKKHAVNSAT